MFKSVNKYVTPIVDILLYNVDEGGCLYIESYLYLLYAALLCSPFVWQSVPEETPEHSCSTERE